MFKAVILLKQREDMSLQEFRSWWIGKHAALTRQLPGIKRLCFNVVESENALYDGISELWFETEADFDGADKCEIGKAVAENSMSHLSRRDRLFVQENEIVSES